MEIKGTWVWGVVIGVLVGFTCGALGNGLTSSGTHLIQSCKAANQEFLFTLMQDPYINSDPSMTKVLNDCMGVQFEENSNADYKDGN